MLKIIASLTLAGIALVQGVDTGLRGGVHRPPSWKPPTGRGRGFLSTAGMFPSLSQHTDSRYDACMLKCKKCEQRYCDFKCQQNGGNNCWAVCNCSRGGA
jgi:hypothetical protein